MIFNINKEDNVFFYNLYDKIMKELCVFFEIEWKRNVPNIFVIKDRHVFNKLRNDKNEGVLAWTYKNNIYILDRSFFKQYPKEYFERLLKHELAHLFINIICGNQEKLPLWFREGIPIYVSDQYLYNTPLNKFVNLFSGNIKQIYYESPIAVKRLIDNFGKNHILELLKLAKEKEFNDAFYNVFGSYPTLNFFNSLE